MDNGSAIQEWCLVESDPHKFMTLISKFGANDVEVCEVWDIEQRLTVETEGPETYGLIFLFKWTKDFSDKRNNLAVSWDLTPNLFFAKQVIPNACATQAILSILLNCSSPNLDIGHVLSNLREFSLSFEPELKGLSIAQCDEIRTAHNSFAALKYFDLPAKKPDAEQDDFHFVAFVPVNGTIYEIDGLLTGPIPVGVYDSSDRSSWTRVAHAVLQERIACFSGDEIRFNLMAVQEDKRKHLNKILPSLPADCIEAGRIKDEIAFENARHAENVADLEKSQFNYAPLAYGLLKRIVAHMPNVLYKMIGSTLSE